MIYLVKALFRESCGSGDLDAARAHTKSLNWLINNLPTSEMAPPPLRVVLWSDAVYSLRQLRRPVIDYLDWMPHLRKDIWESAVPLLIGMCQDPGHDKVTQLRPNQRGIFSEAKRKGHVTLGALYGLSDLTEQAEHTEHYNH